ncbi:MAG TPA: amidohydrolase family protein, partial [bacterium]|nr:amidohydrolase family protein [bacterium]
WEKCGELGLPVEIHTSDPKAFFTTFDEHNERYEELVDNQNWMFNKPEYYGKDELLEQRNNVIERHPDTVFIGAHFGNLPENLGRVGEWLDKYPNFYVDVDARLSELGRQPYSARRFIIKYQDRIMFGTDGNAMGQPIEDMYRIAWRFLETDDEYFDITPSHKFQARWRVYGLYLPDDVLKKVYQTNALKLIPGSKVTI